MYPIKLNEVTFKVANIYFTLFQFQIRRESLKMGETHNKVGRVHQDLKSTDNSPPPAYVMFKDHKVTEEGEPCPPTRQVCGAKDGPQARLSHLLSIILTPVADKLSDEVGTECSSTE